jgi:hypothetical protein
MSLALLKIALGLPRRDCGGQGGIRTVVSQMAVFCGYKRTDICQYMTVSVAANNTNLLSLVRI